MNKDKYLDKVGLAHLWKRITDYVQGVVPKKMSELKNDMGYTSNGVTSFNGSTGAVVYHGVDTVNGKKGNVQLAIPTKTSELENDSGFITEGGTIDAYTKSQTDTLLSEKQDTIDDLNSIRSGAALGTTALQNYTETDPTVPQWAKASTKPTYTAQEVGALPANTPLPTGIPSGGTTGQVLKKTSSTDYAVEWSNESGGGSGSGEENVIETVKVNGTALVPDQYKAVDVTVPTNGVTFVNSAITDAIQGSQTSSMGYSNGSAYAVVIFDEEELGLSASNTLTLAAAGNAITIDGTGISLNSTNVSSFASKVSNATNGHLAGLDGNGNLTDSGFKIVTITESAYEALATKDANTLYLITES